MCDGDSEVICNDEESARDSVGAKKQVSRLLIDQLPKKRVRKVRLVETRREYRLETVRGSRHAVEWEIYYWRKEDARETCQLQ